LEDKLWNKDICMSGGGISLSMRFVLHGEQNNEGENNNILHWKLF